MSEERKKTALITGASSGIGYELAKLFADEGYNLVLVSRDTNKLNEIAGQFFVHNRIRAVAIEKDLFDPQAAQEIYDEVKRIGFDIDVLVNDAGQGVYGEFVNTDLQQELSMIQLNINSLVVLTKLFLKDMVARNEGKILNLASMVSKVPAPFQAVYAGTKAFVYNFSQSIADEVKDKNITVTALRPGATDTDFFNKAGAQESKIVQEGHLADPAKVAKDGYDALMNGSTQVVSGFGNKVQDKLGNLIPDETLAAQMHKQSEPVSH